MYLYNFHIKIHQLMLVLKLSNFYGTNYLPKSENKYSSHEIKNYKSISHHKLQTKL